MKKFFLAAALLTIALPAMASNKFAFVNSKYIDENTSWATIATTAYYEIETPVQYIVNGQYFNGMQTCQSNGKLFAVKSNPVFGPGANDGVIGTTTQTIEIPTNTTATICTYPNGGPAHQDCVPVIVPVAQTLKMSFDVPVKAVQSYYQQHTVKSYWGVAFTKTFTVPACN